MLMKRDEGGETRPSREELEGMSFDDLTAGLADGTITRAKALKLAGAALLGGAFTLLWPGEADARNRRRRRRKKRRRRRRKAQVTQTTPLVPVLGGITDLVLQITNPSDKPLTVSDVQLLGSDFLSASLEEGAVTIAPGATLTVPIDLQTGNSPVVDAGELRLIDGRGMPITVVDEQGVVVGNGDLDLTLVAPEVL